MGKGSREAPELLLRGEKSELSSPAEHLEADSNVRTRIQADPILREQLDHLDRRGILGEGFVEFFGGVCGHQGLPWLWSPCCPPRAALTLMRINFAGKVRRRR